MIQTVRELSERSSNQSSERNVASKRSRSSGQCSYTQVIRAKLVCVSKLQISENKYTRKRTRSYQILLLHVKTSKAVPTEQTEVHLDTIENIKLIRQKETKTADQNKTRQSNYPTLLKINGLIQCNYYTYDAFD